MQPVPPPNYSAKDVAITQRPTSTSLLCIDSEDRFKDYRIARLNATDDPYNFLITKNESIMNGFFTRLGLTEVNFQWAIPNINQKTSQIGVFYSIAGVPQPSVLISIDPGFYTPSQLAAAIQLAVRAIENPPATFPLSLFTMTYGTGNNPLFEYATNAVGVAIGFFPLAANYNLSSPFYFPYESTVKQLFDVLGFSASNINIVPANAGGPTFCQFTRYVDIVCEQLTYNQALKDTMSQTVARDTLCRLYITDPGSSQSTVSPSSATFCPPGCAPATIYRNFSQPKQIQWLPNQPIVGALRFSVFDDAGFPLSQSDPFGLSGQQKCYWSITINVTEN